MPAYAIIIREYFALQEAGARVGAVIMATLIGMALGGWMSGWIFDVTGSYQAGFLFFAALAIAALIGLTAVKGRWRTTWGAPHLTNARI